MGYYLPGPAKGKAQHLVANFDGEVLETPPKSLAELADNRMLVCVVDNGPFEAAGIMHQDRELDAWLNDPSDKRPKTWVTVDKAKAHLASGMDVIYSSTP